MCWRLSLVCFLALLVATSGLRIARVAAGRGHASFSQLAKGRSQRRLVVGPLQSKPPKPLLEDVWTVRMDGRAEQLNGKVLVREALAGTVTALGTIPTSVAYATVVGVSPLVGIWSSAVTGLVTAVVGREPGMITAAAGVIAIPMSVIYKQHGAGYMCVAMLLAGLFEYLFGFLGLGTKLGLYCEDKCDVFSGSAITPANVAGFMNAFAVFLLKKQIKLFKNFAPATLPASLLTAALCVAGINGLPRLIKGVPGSLLGLVFSSLVSVVLLRLPVQSLAEFAGGNVFAGGLSALPSFSGLGALRSLLANSPGGGGAALLQVLSVVLPAALGVATIAILETAIAVEISGKHYAATRTMPESGGIYTPHANMAMKGLGLGNIASALLGGFGGCGVVPNTSLNNKSGGRLLLSSAFCSLMLGLSVVSIAPLIGAIPLAALGGLMVQVAVNTIEWKEIGELVSEAKTGSTHGLVDLLTMVVSTLVCFKDMGLGVLVGIAVSKSGPVVDFFKGLFKGRVRK